MSLETIILPANSISFPRSDVYLDNAFMETITCFGEAQLEGKTSISNLSINGDVDFNGHNITEVGTITSNQLNVNTLSSSNTNPIVVTSDLEYPQSSSFNIKRATGSTPAIVSTFDQSGNVTFNNSVTVNNDLNVNGSLNYVSSTVISTGNASFEFLNANIADMFDFGIFGKRVTTGTTYYDGIFRNHLINRFQIYKNYTGSISGNWINPTLGDLDVSDITFNTWSINSVPVTSTASEINALHGVTPGTATANKVLIFDSSRNIANIASLTATTLSGQLSGSLTTGTQQSITRLGTINQNLTLADTYNLVMGTTSPQTLTASDVSFLHSLNTGGSLSVASLSTDTINPYTPSGPVTISTDLIMGSNKNIVLQGSGTVSASKFSSVPVSNANTPGFYFNGYSNTGLFYDYTNDKIGFVRAGVAGLYVNSNNDINISNDLQMVANKKITWGGLISLSSTDANKIIGITNGSALVNKALVLDSSANVTGINSLSSSVILHGDGTQALPSVSFSSDASTGIWRTSGSVLNFGINNGQKLTLSSSELKLFSANLNLNTNNLINGGSISSNYLLVFSD